MLLRFNSGRLQKHHCDFCDSWVSGNNIFSKSSLFSHQGTPSAFWSHYLKTAEIECAFASGCFVWAPLQVLGLLGGDWFCHMNIFLSYAQLVFKFAVWSHSQAERSESAPGRGSNDFGRSGIRTHFKWILLVVSDSGEAVRCCLPSYASEGNILGDVH